MDAGAGYDNYLWSPNAYVSRNRTVVVTNTGFYTVIVQSQGCVAESDKFEVIGKFKKKFNLKKKSQHSTFFFFF